MYGSGQLKLLVVGLQELVPCVLLSFDDEQILMWRGRDWKSRYRRPISSVPKLRQTDIGVSSVLDNSGVPLTWRKIILLDMLSVF